ncbi:hypothetical protein [Clostridium sp.]|uniref:hypothetical protein n=1 Tax=Clostridium sp. TaxID=1506 RepID=UPI003F4B5925
MEVVFYSKFGCGDHMYKNVKVILVGGSPMSGKTTLATKIASKYFHNCISTDDIGQVIQTVIDVDPMKGHDYREYYIRKSIDGLLKDIEDYHERMWPSIKRLIDIHSTWSNPIIIEGWALYPRLVKELGDKNIKKIWLVCDDKVLEKRLLEAKEFYMGATDKDLMIQNYLKRSIWHNHKIFKEIKEFNEDHIRISVDLTEEELFKRAIEVLER